MLKNILRWSYGAYATAAFVVIVLLMFCPLLVCAPSLTLRRMIGRLTVRAWLWSIFVRLRVKGLHHVPPGACIALCNHASYVDGIVFTAVLPGRFTFLVQHKAADWPYVGLIIKRMGVTFINRESPRSAACGVRSLIRSTRQGGSLAIFPEGDFRSPPGLLPFHDGAFVIAAKTGVPVVPAVMRGTRQFFAEGQRLPTRSAIDVEFFPPMIAVGTYRSDARALSNAARSVMKIHCGESDCGEILWP